MVTRTLEAKLTARLLAVVAPALVAVGVAAVGVTWWALDQADVEATRASARSALGAMRAELVEPDRSGNGLDFHGAFLRSFR